MKKKDMIKTVAKRTEEKEAVVEKVTNTYVEVIKEVVEAGDSYEIKGFGTFSNKINKARKGRNPSTGAPIDIPEAKSVKFKISKAFKDKLNGVEKEEKEK